MSLSGLGRLFIWLGLGLLLLGLLFLLLGRIGLGRLPGDLYYRRGNFAFYFPLATSLLLSALLSLLFLLFRRH